MVSKMTIELTVIYEYDENNEQYKAMKALGCEPGKATLLSMIGTPKTTEASGLKIDSIRDASDGMVIFRAKE